MGWSNENSGGTTHPVGEKLPNDFGLHDMHGNVEEWCRDWYQEDFYQESVGARDPLCENPDSNFRVIRDGFWNSDANHCRSACRWALLPEAIFRLFGFRPTWSSP